MALVIETALTEVIKNTSQTGTYSGSFTATGDGSLYIFVGFFNASAYATDPAHLVVTYNGVEATLVGSNLSDSGSSILTGVACYKLNSPASGSNTLAVNMYDGTDTASEVRSCSAHVMEVSGDDTPAVTATVDVQTQNVTATASGSLIYSITINRYRSGATPYTPNTDDTELFDDVSGPTIGYNDHTFYLGYAGPTDGASTYAVGGAAATPSYETMLSVEITPATSGVHDLSADDVESASEVTAPGIHQVHDLASSDVEAASEVSAPVIGQVHVLSAGSVESASEATTPAVGQVHVLAADDAESASEVSAPNIGQVHNLLASDTESASETTTPAIGQVHVLSGDDVEAASEVTAPAITVLSGHVLAAESVEAASEVSAPTLTQVHVLYADDVEAASEVSQPAINRATQQRGDDAPGMFYGAGESRRFFNAKQIRALEEVAEEIASKPIPAQKARKKLKAVIEPFADSPQPLQAVDLMQRVLKAIPAKNDGEAERAKFMAAVAAYVATAKKEQKRRRDNDALALLLMVA